MELHELEKLLDGLEHEERVVSAKRRKLHDRIAIFPDDSGELERQEREISAHRRELHRRIDELREQRNILRGRQAEQALQARQETEDVSVADASES